MQRHAGEFCWINVLTPDPDADRAFYQETLGWEFAPIPGMGWLILVGGKQCGGLFPNRTPDGTEYPPGIGVMVQVDDAHAMADRMRALGGRAAEPMPVGPQGTMVDGGDPTGAMIDLWQPAAGGSAEHDPEVRGAPFWFELLTRDVPRAVAFYRELFGWTAKAMPMPGFTYTILEREGKGIAGVTPWMPEMGDLPNFWSVYCNVPDVDAAIATAERLGGRLAFPKMEVAGVGPMAGLMSPTGVFFYVMTPTPAA